MKEPLISIITVSYNSAKTIQKTINSVLSQDYGNFEYIIIDGKSKDETNTIIKNFATTSHKIKHISEPDQGIYHAMNKGIQLANGEIIGIINSDDWYEINVFTKIVHAYNLNGLAVFYGIERRVKNENEFIIERGNHNFLHEKMIPHSTSFVPNEFYKIHGLFDTRYSSAADYDLMLRLKRKGVHFVPIDSVISNFQIGGKSSNLKGSIESLRIKHKYGYINSKDYLLKSINIRLLAILKKIFSYKKN